MEIIYKCDKNQTCVVYGLSFYDTNEELLGVYIGQTKNCLGLKERISQHIHGDSTVRKFLNTHDITTMEVLSIECPREELDRIERQKIIQAQLKDLPLINVIKFTKMIDTLKYL